MSAENQNPSADRGTASEAMPRLFADPLTELTRRRQTWLLITATLTLLLSAGLVETKEATVAGVKVTWSLPQVAEVLAVAVTAYLLVVYVLLAVGDLAAAAATRERNLKVLEGAEAALMDEDHRLIRASIEQMTEITRLNEELAAARAQADLDREELLQERLKEAMDGWEPEELASGLKGSSEEDDFTEQVVDVSSGLNQFRIWVEILFPTLYGSIAVVWAVVWTALHL